MRKTKEEFFNYVLSDANFILLIEYYEKIFIVEYIIINLDHILSYSNFYIDHTSNQLKNMLFLLLPTIEYI